MKINVLGGGPAGLYFSLLMKKTDPRHEVTVYERNPPGATFGWGVVFSEGSLDELKDADYESFIHITESFARWDPISVQYRGETVRCRGHLFSGIERRTLLAILQERCANLGVRLRFEAEQPNLEAVSDADLVVAADGVNSNTRRELAEWLRPTIEYAPSKYVWYGADLAFPEFNYLIEPTPYGLFQAHCYPFNAERSTMIVLLSEATWQRAGFDRMSEQESLAFNEQIFARALRGRHLLSNRSLWINFPWVRCQYWHHHPGVDGGPPGPPVVLMGDAVHTAHWSIGSGTKLALEDAIALSKAFIKFPRDLKAAFAEYETARQPATERFQEASRVSCDYFQSLDRYAHFEPVQFAFQLLARTPRISHNNLAARDPEFVRLVDSWFWRRASGIAHPAGEEEGGHHQIAVAPPPAFAPFDLRGVRFPNRVVASAARIPAGDAAGILTNQAAGRIAALAATGAGTILGPMLAVSPEGRPHLAAAGLWSHDQARAWADLGLDRLVLRLGHAGRRAACLPPEVGVDIPLPAGAWPLLSASPLAYTPWSPLPAAASAADLTRIRDAFVASARLAELVRPAALELDFGLGGLLASFLSPLTNQRTDGYGGDLAGRLRFPLEVLRAVREVWAERPLIVAYSATDWARGGLSQSDSLAIARALGEAADLIHVLTGQTVLEENPQYGRAYGAAISDVVRNTAGVATICEGQLTTLDELNTTLAAGRADLCVLDIL